MKCRGLLKHCVVLLPLVALPVSPRVIKPEAFKLAKAILSRAPAHSSVHFIVVGSSRETEDFELQIEAMFEHAGWQISARDFVHSESDSAGNGVVCQVGTQSAGTIALRAMRIAGYPCRIGPVAGMPEREPADFYIAVGAIRAPVSGADNQQLH